MKCNCRHEEEDHNLRRDRSRGGCQVKRCSCKKFECGHWRLKKNYPFGKSSNPSMSCKDCNSVVKNKMIRDRNLKLRM